MSRSDAATLLAATGYPVVYYEWPDGSTPTFPCIRYVLDGTDDFRADNANYAGFDRWSATLVTEWKDDAAEAKVEETLANAGVTFVKYGDLYVRAERLNHVEYTFTLPR